MLLAVSVAVIKVSLANRHLSFGAHPLSGVHRCSHQTGVQTQPFLLKRARPGSYRGGIFLHVRCEFRAGRLCRGSATFPTVLAQAPWKRVSAHGKQIHQRRLGIVETVIGDDHHRAATVCYRILRPQARTRSAHRRLLRSLRQRAELLAWELSHR